MVPVLWMFVSRVSRRLSRVLTLWWPSDSCLLVCCLVPDDDDRVDGSKL